MIERLILFARKDRAPEPMAALTVRRDTRPEQIRRNIYRVLRVQECILSQSSDGPKLVSECARQPA